MKEYQHFEIKCKRDPYIKRKIKLTYSRNAGKVIYKPFEYCDFSSKTEACENCIKEVNGLILRDLDEPVQF